MQHARILLQFSFKQPPKRELPEDVCVFPSPLRPLPVARGGGRSAPCRAGPTRARGASTHTHPSKGRLSSLSSIVRCADVHFNLQIFRVPLTQLSGGTPSRQRKPGAQPVRSGELHKKGYFK